MTFLYLIYLVVFVLVMFCVCGCVCFETQSEFVCVGFHLIFLNQIKQMSVLDGNMQQYVYKQEPAKQCQRRARVTIRYPAFIPRLVIRRRVQRAVRTPTIIRTVRINPYPAGNFRLLSFFYTTI